MPVAVLSTAHGWTGASRRERYLYYPADRWCLARFPRVIAVSSQIRTELIQSGAAPDRVVVLLNGIDHRVFHRVPSRVADARTQFGFPANAIVVGAVGRLESQKRFDLLLDAFAAASRSEPALFLAVAGDGTLREDLAAQVQRLGLGTRCRLVGHVADVNGFHHAIDVLVQSSDYEGTPNAVLEAMAMETAVVATDAGGTAEICRPGVDGLIVRPGDVEALAAALVRTVADPASTAARVAAARERVSTELSFERRVKALEDIYVQLASSSHA